MRIRAATVEDLEPLLEMGARMHAEGAYSFLPYDREKLHRLKDYFFAHPDTHCVLVAEQDGAVIGMLGGYLTDYYFCQEKLACDQFFFVERAWRGSRAAAGLIAAFRAWAEARGARELCLATSVDVNTEKTGRFYEGLGFRCVGGVYKQRLEPRWAGEPSRTEG